MNVTRIAIWTGFSYRIKIEAGFMTLVKFAIFKRNVVFFDKK